MDQAGLCSFIEIERWIEHLFNLQCREVPKGWAPLTLQQLISADKALFIHASENLAGNLVSVTGAPKPFDLQIKQLMYANEIVQHLTLLPKAEPPQGTSIFTAIRTETMGRAKARREKARGARLKPAKSLCRKVALARLTRTSRFASHSIVGNASRRRGSGAPEAFMYVGRRVATEASLSMNVPIRVDRMGVRMWRPLGFLTLTLPTSVQLPRGELQMIRRLLQSKSLIPGRSNARKFLN